MSDDSRPLDNIRVLDFTHVLAGPFCTYQLAVMGADVIKIESAQRPDMMRMVGPDFELAKQAMGLHFQAQASNKRAMTLDLKHADSSEILDKLLLDADVLVVNYRRGAAKRLNIDYERVKKVNPQLVYCSMTGFGQTGPKADHAAYDNVIQAFSGLMAATGTEEGGPTRVGPPVLDYGTGAQAALAIVSSLFQRERTGEGNCIDIAMLDAAMMLMSATVTDTAIRSTPPVRPGNRSVKATYGCYQTNDGDLMIGAYTREQIIKLWYALEREDKVDEVNALALENLDDAHDDDTQILVDVFQTKSAEQWEAILNSADVPAARVRSVDESLKEPQVESRQVTQSVLSPTKPDERLTIPVAAWQSSHGSPRVDAPPPFVGQHTAEILQEIGIEPAQIEQYRKVGCI
ncbi:MAG: CaiB/BaiF CoA-transferase family protein [Granulosicoccaceae bacterium]